MSERPPQDIAGPLYIIVVQLPKEKTANRLARGWRTDLDTAHVIVTITLWHDSSKLSTPHPNTTTLSKRKNPI